ncbi:MAG: transcriptional regulator [Thermoplasmata archaeon]|nr:MAG: transcriptional regulator [Thermoplasmata archaeon]
MDIKDILAEKMAGEITLSPRPGKTIRKWRNIFTVSQTELANYLGLSPSVISDYESGRRKSPGIQTIRRIVNALLEIDEKKNNAQMLRRYQFLNKKEEGILDIMEYPYPISVKDFIQKINGTLLSLEKNDHSRSVKGFTLIDGIKTIQTINSTEYVHLYGWNTERALIFTGVKYGRSPMIAIRIHPVKPAVVVYHRPAAVDPLAVNLADRERIPLVVTNLPLEDLKKKLVSIGRE